MLRNGGEAAHVAANVFSEGLLQAIAEPWLPKTTVCAAFPGGWMFGAPN